jgi:hypothetical protein
LNNGGHLEWNSDVLDKIWNVENPRTIPAKFSSNWLGSFREEDI